MKFILGKKLMMTQVWNDDKVIAVTPVLASPCVIAQVKTKTRDGYEAVQLATGVRKAKNINKPQLGHVKNLDIKPAHLREFRVEDTTNFKVGDVISVGTFAIGDTINVTGTSKGKGFQGVVKRHHFHGFRKTHGNKDQERMPGSIGPKGPAHVFKGMKMGGRMGGERVTTTNLEVISVDSEKDIIYVKGAVPGAINGLITIVGRGDIQLNLKKEVAKVEENQIEAEETPVIASEVKEALTEAKDTLVEAKDTLVEAKETVAEIKETLTEASEVKEESKTEEVKA